MVVVVVVVVGSRYSGNNGIYLSRSKAQLMLWTEKLDPVTGICNLSVCIKYVLPGSSGSS